jgi:Fic family protein
MAAIRKRTVAGKEYYYLEHSMRVGGSVEKKELYIGRSLPKDIESVKRKFLAGIYSGKWHAQFDRIRAGFRSEQGKMPPSALEKETESFMIRFTYDTNRIEGSALTLRETADLLERGITPNRKPMRDIKETEAHREVFYAMLAHQKEASQSTMLEWHAKLLGTTKPDVAGRLRNHQVAISGSKFLPPAPVEVPALMSEFFSWYGRNRARLHPVELAALCHLKLVTIHPFSDGNGRISRLLMNFVLKKHGYPMLNIRYGNRSGYYSALERAQAKKEELVFVSWFFKRYAKENARYAKTA